MTNVLNFETAYDPTTEITLSTQEAAALTETSTRTARWQTLSGALEAWTDERDGRRPYRIRLMDLPLEAQARYWAMQEKGATEADVAGYRQKWGEAGLEKLLRLLGAVRTLETLRRNGRRDVTAQRDRLAAALGMSGTRLYQYEQAYQKDGLSGLMGVPMRSDKGKSRSMCRMAEDYLTDAYCRNSKITQNVACRNVQRLAEELGEKACAVCPYNPASLYHAELRARSEVTENDACPYLADENAEWRMRAPENRYAVNRFLKNLDPGVAAMGRQGARYWEAHYMPKALRRKPEKVNEVWFGDHHVFDCFVEVNGRPVRPWLTAWMDARSGCMVGWMLSVNPNSHTIIESLCGAMGHTQGSPFYGIPQMLYIDNGKDYRCKRIEGDRETEIEIGRLNLQCTGDNALLKTLGIGVTHAIPYRAWSKTIERAFGIIETQWIREVPCWCGNGIERRPEELSRDIRAGRMWKYEEFVAYFTNVVLPEYHAYVQPDDKKGLSPLAIYERSAKVYGDQAPSWALLGMAKSQRTERKVTTQGVSFFGKVYGGAGLDGHIGQTVQVLYNTEEDETLTVLDKDSRYLTTVTAVTPFKLIGEDEETLDAHMARQYGRKKEVREALKLNRSKVRMLGLLAGETPNLALDSSITSLLAEQAQRGKDEAEEEKRAEEAQARKRARQSGNRVASRLRELGQEALKTAGE